MVRVFIIFVGLEVVQGGAHMSFCTATRLHRYRVAVRRPDRWSRLRTATANGVTVST